MTGAALIVVVWAGECAVLAQQRSDSPCVGAVAVNETRVFSVPANEDCVVKVTTNDAVPSSHSNHKALYEIRLEASAPTAFSAELIDLQPRRWSAAQGPDPGVSEVASETVGPRQRLLVWSSPAGWLVIKRQDLERGPTTIAVTVRDATNDPIQRQDGHATRLRVDAATYSRLIGYAGCVRGDGHDESCLAGLAKDAFAWPSDWFSGVEDAQKADRVTAELYYLVSRWMARDPVFEFAAGKKEDAPESKKHGSQSDPIVLFIGAGGRNRIVMLDCHAVAEEPVVMEKAAEKAAVGEKAAEKPGVTEKETSGRCEDFAAPGSRSLERASAFWAMYVEDDEAPFDTTIEVAFGGSRRDPDYEEFDPRVRPAELVAAKSAGVTNAADKTGSDTNVERLFRRIRIGYRQFSIRVAPTTAEVTFTRQGSGYGLRQWMGVLRQRSKLLVVPAAAIFAPSIPAVQITRSLAPVFAGGAVEASAYQVVEQRARRPVFALLSIQTPQLRSTSDNAGTTQRLLLGLIPDAALGWAGGKIFFTGGSWPIPLWPEKTFITTGLIWTRQTVFVEPLHVGDRLPSGGLATPDTIWDKAFRVGLSLELTKFRR